MNRPGSGLSEDAGSILRAIGSLLVALSGGDDTATQRLLVTLDDQGRGQRSQRPEPRFDPGVDPGFELPQHPAEGRPSYREPRRPEAGGRPIDQVEFILRDARDRAQQILDESTERARELIRRSSQPSAGNGGDHERSDDLRRSIHGLVTEVRDIQQRLGRIEAILTSQRGPANAPEARYTAAPASPPSTQAPRVTAPPEAAPSFSSEPRRAAPMDAPPPEVTPPDYPDVPPPEPSALGGDASPPPLPSVGGTTPSPAPSPPRAPFSVVPPQRREWTEPSVEPEVESPAFEVAAPPPSAVPRMREQPPEIPTGNAIPSETARDDVEDLPSAPGDSGAPIATFLPGDGAIILRVTPVSGFQGLMRVQDALARLPSVRQASVEAYSQGEARLRIDLLDATDSEELAAGLGQALQVSANVRDASERDRQLLIALR